VRAVVEKFVPTVAEAIDLVQGRVPGRRHHHAVLVLCRARRAVEPRTPPPGSTPNWVYLLDGAAIYISDPLPGCTRDAKGIRHHAGRRDCRALR
jgi:hypothetical protein